MSDLEKEAHGGYLVITERIVAFRRGVTRGNRADVNSESRRKVRGVFRRVSQRGRGKGH